MVDPLHWEETTCTWCGATAYDVLFEGPDRLHGLPGTFQFVRCQQCGVLRQNPRLTWASLSQYYPEDYVSYHYDAEEDRSPLQAWIKNRGNRKRRRAIERFQPGGRLLEVGCGTGAFLREMARSGHWDVVGVEPNERAASYARQTVECTVLQSTFADADLEEASFEAIVLWCVVEHLAHPIEDLRRAYTLLKPSGWLVFSVPNYESFGARIFGKFWSGWDLPRHLYVFPRTIMNDILVSTGFHNISAHCISTSYQALGHSLDFWFQNWADQYPKLERALRQVYYSWIMRLGLFIPLAVLERFNLTTNITYFAQKS